MRASRLPVISAGSLLWKKVTLRGWSESRYAARMNDISVMIGRKEPADGRLANDVYYATVCDMKSNLALHSSRWEIAICICKTSGRLIFYICLKDAIMFTKKPSYQSYMYVWSWKKSIITFMFGTFPSFQCCTGCWETIFYKHLCCKKEPWK